MAEAITLRPPSVGPTNPIVFHRQARPSGGRRRHRTDRDTIVLVAATANRRVREGQDFFPLTVDVEERNVRGGQGPARSSVVRAGRPTRRSSSTGSSTVRFALLPGGFRNEVHVVATVFGADQRNP